MSGSLTADLGALGPEVDPDVAPTRGRDGVAGFLGAAAALVTIEVVSLFDASGVSVTEAVQNAFIDTFAASLKEIAVSLFGTNDKAALQIGTALVVAALGAALAGAAGPRRWVVAGGFTGFAVLGVVVSLGDPLASGPTSVVAALAAAAGGVGVVAGLQRRWSGPGCWLPTAAAELGPVRPAGRVDRRSVLAGGGATALGLAVAAAMARSVRASLRLNERTAPRALARTGAEVELPVQPFDVSGLSPYVTPTAEFYRIDTALRVPVVDPDSWQLKVTGMVERELTFTYAELMARRRVDAPITIQCVSNEVGGNLIGTAVWSGVPLAELLDEAGVHDGADQVMGESIDGFTAGFPLEAATDGRDTLVAVGMNGRTLDSTHGFPARLIVPGLYGYVSATKWITEIRLTSFAAEQGFWVPRGWSAQGPIKLQSRIDVPESGAPVPAGEQSIGGVAWAPHSGVSGVEVRVDDGPWRPATLGRVASVDTWVQWRADWQATPGIHQIEVRAIGRDGEVQTAALAPPAPDGATGHHTIEVRVT